MLKPPAPTIPGMTDSLEFVKNLWGGMNVPGVGVPGLSGPALSTDELDKRIADLKAVETWLNLNTTMLRGTIQALEVQRGTIATLKSMGASMAQAMGQAGAAGTPGMASPFAAFFAQPGAGAPAATPAPSQATQPKQGAPGAAAPQANEPPAAAAAMPAAVAWWNLLQDQFTQAVASAMSPDAMAGAMAMAQDAAARMGGTPTPTPTPGAGAQPETPSDQGGGGGGASAQPGTPKPRAAKSRAEKS